MSGLSQQRGGVSWIGQKRIDDGSEMDGMSVLFQLLVDADVILAESAGTDDGDLKSRGQGRDLLALHGSEAAGVKLEQVSDLVVRLGGRGSSEASGGTACLAADAGGGGYKFEQVEGNVFIATGGCAGGAGGDFHEFSSYAMLSGTGRTGGSGFAAWVGGCSRWSPSSFAEPEERRMLRHGAGWVRIAIRFAGLSSAFVSAG